MLVRFHTIRIQMLIPIIVASLGGFAAQAIAWQWVRRGVEESVLQQLQDVVQSVTTGTYPLTDSVLQQLKGLTGADFFLVNVQGARGTRNLSAAELTLLNANPIGSQYFPVQIFGKIYRIASVQLSLTHPNAGSAFWILYPENKLEALIYEITGPSWVTLFIGACSGLVAIGIGNRLVRSLHRLQVQVKQISQGNFEPQHASVSVKELAEMQEQLNKMALELADRQRQLQDATRLELRSQIALGLAHQLRNATTGARLALQVHRDGCVTDVESLDMVERQLRILESFARRFLELDRPEEASMSTILLGEVLDSVQKIVSPMIKYREIVLQIQPFEPTLSLKGNAEQLTELLFNLLGNAMEAAGPAGKVQCIVQDNPPWIQVQIRDNGPGPNAEVMEHLFEPFITGKPEGLGLGLTLAKSIVTRHRGHIRWFREANETVFEVLLPS